MLSFFENNTWIAEWLLTLTVFSGLVTFLKRLKKERDKRRSDIRTLVLKIRNQLKFPTDEVQKGDAKEKIKIEETLDELIGEIAQIKEISKSVISLRKLLSAQLYWLNKGFSHWVSNLDNFSSETDREWVAGAMNGLLDVVKDDILYDSDYEHIHDSFWVDMATYYLDDEYDGEILLKPTTEDYSKAIDRWLDKSQRKNMRIIAIIKYKVKAEFALILCLRGNFSDPSIREWPRSKKFLLSIQFVWNELLKEFQEHLEDACNGSCLFKRRRKEHLF